MTSDAHANKAVSHVLDNLLDRLGPNGNLIDALWNRQASVNAKTMAYARNYLREVRTRTPPATGPIGGQVDVAQQLGALPADRARG